MSGKNQVPFTANWQSSDPRTGFIPNPNLYGNGSPPSAVLAGTMSATNVIYSNIIDVSRMDNIGLEVAWTGTPGGVLKILVSNSGKNFNELTFNPVLAQPAGAAGGMAVSINQLPFKFLMFKYTNASGSGSLSIYGQEKDLN